MLRWFLTFSVVVVSGFYFGTFGQHSHTGEYFFTKFEKGVPASVGSNAYFNRPENISNALIFQNVSDSLYLIQKLTDSDSCSYILILISNNKITGFDYPEVFVNNKDTLFAMSTMTFDNDYKLELNYHPSEEIIRYRLVKAKSTFPLDVEFGIRDEAAVLFASYYNYKSGISSQVETSFPLNLHFYIGFMFFERYKLYFRTGILYLYEDYSGRDNGIYGEVKLFNSNFYGITGINFFSNSGEGHGVMVYSDASGEITSLCFGLGFAPQGHLSLDIMYYAPLNKSYGYNYVIVDPSGNISRQRYDKVTKGLLVLGFQYSIFL